MFILGVSLTVKKYQSYKLWYFVRTRIFLSGLFFILLVL